MTRITRTPVLGAAAGIAAFVALAMPGAAQADFSGSCQFKGGGTVSPGVTFMTKQQTLSVTMTGNCTGGAGRLELTASGPIGCTGGRGSASGSGTLRVGSESIPVKVSWDVNLPVGELRLASEAGGSAVGQTPFGDPANVPEMTKCPGQGLKKLSFSYNMRGSLKTPGGGGGGGGSSQPAPSVRVSVDRSQSGSRAASRGFKVNCRSARAGRCSVTVRQRGSNRVIASGRRSVGAGRTVKVTVRFTSAGKRALKRRGTLRTTVRVQAPSAVASRSVSFR